MANVSNYGNVCHLLSVIILVFLPVFARLAGLNQVVRCFEETFFKKLVLFGSILQSMRL